MSDPMIQTDETRPHTCGVPGCGVATIQRKLVGAFQGGEHWATDKHAASCGLPCYGAGVPGRAYRIGEYHRDDTECPRCGPAPEIRTRLREYRERGQRFESGVRMAVDVIERGAFGEGINQLSKSDVLLELKEMLDEARQRCPGSVCDDDTCKKHNACRGCGNAIPADRTHCGAIECGQGELP